MTLDLIIDLIEDMDQTMPVSGGDASPENPLMFTCNDKTGLYNAAEKIHLFIEYWALANLKVVVKFLGSRLLGPNTKNRFIDEIELEVADKFSNDGGSEKVFLYFDVTEPFRAGPESTPFLGDK